MEKKNMMVGLGIVAMIVLLVVGTFVFQKVQPGKLIFTVQFAEANKLKAGDAVYVKGLKIGEVRSVDLDDVHRVIVAKVILDSKRDLPNDSFFFIWPDKLITDSKCIQIKLGESATFIKRGDVVIGESSMLKIMTRIDLKWLKSAGLWWDALEKEVKDSGIGANIKSFWEGLTK